jgi:hypothetical protein
LRVGTARITVALAMVLVCLHVAAGQAWGIVFCTGQDPNSHKVTPPSNYDGVAFINSGEGATAVLINPWYILTANHASYNWVGSTATFNLSGGTQVFSMMEKFTCPNADLAIIRLNRDTGLTGYPLYDPNVYGLETSFSTGGTLLGYGMSGTSATVQAGGDPNYPRGTLRLGYNKIEYIYSNLTYPDGSPLGTCLLTHFHQPPSGLGASKEAMVAVGDSGGPVLIYTGGQLRLAGITATVSQPADPNHWPQYDIWGYHVRVADYASWINSKIPALPAPQTGDFNNDGNTNVADIDALFAHYGSIDMWYDVSDDDVISRPDSDYLIRDLIGTEYGDTNLDHLVNLTDYEALAANFGLTGTAGWAKGDFNGDKSVTFADYQILEAYFGYGTGGSLPIPSVPLPEPTTLILLACGGGLLIRRTPLRRG